MSKYVKNTIALTDEKILSDRDWIFPVKLKGNRGTGKKK